MGQTMRPHCPDMATNVLVPFLATTRLAAYHLCRARSGRFQLQTRTKFRVLKYNTGPVTGWYPWPGLACYLISRPLREANDVHDTLLVKTVECPGTMQPQAGPVQN